MREKWRVLFEIPRNIFAILQTWYAMMQKSAMRDEELIFQNCLSNLQMAMTKHI